MKGKQRQRQMGREGLVGDGFTGRFRVVCLALWAAAVLALSFQLAWERIFVLSFSSINGDFQSYNVFRRMLDGQAPYKDFANYIGMAPVVINLPFLLFKGDFAASLFVTNFTSSLLFSLVVLALFRLAGNRWPVTLLASAVFTKLISSGLVGRLLGSGAGGYLTRLFTNLYTPSNSMRIARIFWPFLLAGLLALSLRGLRRKTGRPYPLRQLPQSRWFCLLVGLATGMGILWSNDFGLATAFCAALFMMILLVGEKAVLKVFAVNMGLYFAAAGGGLLLAATVASGGQPLAYFRYTAGVASFQYFYFNGTGGRALLPYIFTNLRLWLFTLPYLVFLVGVLVLYFKKRLDDRLLLAAFLAATVVVATYAYIISGSGYNFTEALEGGLWLALAAVVVAFAGRALKTFGRQQALGAAALLTVAALLFSGVALRDFWRTSSRPREGVYLPQLGGYVTYPKALVEADALTSDEQVFSLYATGLEAVKGQFQPSGYDYVIHALGPKAQEDYLASLTKGQYPFVQTTNLGVEGWLAGINWYVYREIAANYQRVFVTEYSWIWERTDNRQLAIEAKVTVSQQEGRWLLEVTAPPGTDFVADIRIVYTTAFATPLSGALSLGRRAAGVSIPNPFQREGAEVGFYLPPQSDGWYIPVAVRNGHGVALLFGSDPAHVTVQLQGAELVRALPPLDLPPEA